MEYQSRNHGHFVGGFLAILWMYHDIYSLDLKYDYLYRLYFWEGTGE